MLPSSHASQRNQPRVLTGPVVGRVTSTSARLLLEVGSDAMVEATAVGGNGERIEVRTHLSARRPGFIVLEGLRPETAYVVSFAGVRSELNARFRTPPVWPERLRLACVSCNDPATGNPALPAWTRLLTSVDTDDVDLVLHLGDQVYADPAFEKGLFYLKRTGNEEQVREVFRDVYRQTWSVPQVAAVLARTSNLMIWDDHDVHDNWSAISNSDATPAEKRVLDIARETYREYQAGLLDPSADISGSASAMHAHQFGTTGVILLDERGGRERRDRSSGPFLGGAQWAALERQLSEAGPMAGVRHLIVAGPLPIAFLNDGLTSVLARFVPDLRDHWSHEFFRPERQRLLDLLRAWRSAAAGREVILAAGDAHVGLISEVRHTDGTIFRQLVASPVSSPPHPGALRWLLERVSGDSIRIAGGYTFRHLEWTSELNFGQIETGPGLNARLITAGR